MRKSVKEWQSLEESLETVQFLGHAVGVVFTTVRIITASCTFCKILFLQNFSENIVKQQQSPPDSTLWTQFNSV